MHIPPLIICWPWPVVVLQYQKENDFFGDTERAVGFHDAGWAWDGEGGGKAICMLQTDRLARDVCQRVSGFGMNGVGIYQEILRVESRGCIGSDLKKLKSPLFVLYMCVIHSNME